MNINELKMYLAETKKIRDLGLKAIETISIYLQNEFKDLIIKKPEYNILEINCFGYVLLFRVDIDWSKIPVEAILQVFHKTLNNKNQMEEKSLLTYHFDKSGDVFNSTNNIIGHVSGGTEKDFQKTFITDVFSKLIETEKLSALNQI